MKPGDLVRFRQELVPQFDISRYDGDICLIVEMAKDRSDRLWIRGLHNGTVKGFRQEFFEVIDETR